jgi:alcohol dehydrogenase YqhD (iron-dependent ADH family)
VELTDRMSEAVLKTVINNARIVLKDPENYDARAEIMWAGTIAHNGLLGTGRSEDWATHKIEHELSGIYDVAHGAGLTAIHPAWMRYVYKENVNRFVQFAHRVWDIKPCAENPERTALEGIERTALFYKAIGLPISLDELGIPEDRLEEMAQKATERGPVGGFKKLFKEDVLNILKLAR